MKNLLVKDAKSLTTQGFLSEFSDRCYNFYDWFCKDSSLKGKAAKLFGNTKSIIKANEKSKMFDFPKGSEVFFKNCCPCYGNCRLYDKLSFCDSDGECIVSVAPASPYNLVEMYRRDTDDYIYFNSIRDLCSFIKDSDNWTSQTVKHFGEDLTVMARKNAA